MFPRTKRSPSILPWLTFCAATAAIVPACGTARDTNSNALVDASVPPSASSSGADTSPSLASNGSNMPVTSLPAMPASQPPGQEPSPGGAANEPTRGAGAAGSSAQPETAQGGRDGAAGAPNDTTPSAASGSENGAGGGAGDSGVGGESSAGGVSGASSGGSEAESGGNSDAGATATGGTATGGAATGGAAAGSAGTSSAGAGSLAGCPKSGDVSYAFTDVAAFPADALEKLSAALDEAVWYYNCYSDLSHSLRIAYKPSVPTAEANVDGLISFGSDRNYMVVATVMHEIGHTMGVGFSPWSQLIADGRWTGENVNEVISTLPPEERDSGDGERDYITADSQHFWPYGLNYASEHESEWSLINHVRIVDAMNRDKDTYR